MHLNPLNEAHRKWTLKNPLLELTGTLNLMGIVAVYPSSWGETLWSVSNFAGINSAPEKNRGFVEGRVYRHIVCIWSIQSLTPQVRLYGWHQTSFIFIQDYVNILESREMSCLNSPSTAFQRLTFFILFAPTLPTLRLPDCKRRQSGWGMTWHDMT